MARQRESLVPDALRDLTLWPSIDPHALEPAVREVYRAREQAITHFVQGEPMQHVVDATGVAGGQIHRLLRRCLMRHPDGRIYGWRALIPELRIKSYVRLRTVNSGVPGKFGGASGAMTQLLERFPALLQFLQRELAQHRLVFSPTGRLLGLIHAHRLFISHCRELGLTHRHYPLSQEQKGVRALAQAIRRIATETFSHAAKASGAEQIHPNRPPSGWPDPTPITRTFEAVEFDGHKLDVRLRLRSQDPQGVERDLEIGRAWLLVVLDVASRAVLGWRFAVVAEYNRHDVIQCITHALRPKRKRKQFVIPGMRYEASAGFVDEVATGAAYALWDWLRFDNARANLAEDTLLTLTETLGCIADAGPIGDPNERAYIERFFGTIASHLSHRLPGTTGYSPRDVRRILSDPHGKTELLLTPAELEELVEVTIANYNGTPHSGLGSRTPLEAASISIARERGALRTLPMIYQRHPHLLQPAHIATIRGNPRRGLRPYVSFYGVRYSSLVLGEATRLIGKPLRLHMDPDDVRVIWSYLPSGEELGPLTAARPWNGTPHSLRLRQEILRMRRRKQLEYGELDDPVLVFAIAQRKHGAKRRKVKPGLAEAETALQQRVTPPLALDTMPTARTNRPARPKSLAHLGKGPILK